MQRTTFFFGRAKELAAVADSLERQHVTTITGPAGVGKTRLAVRAVADSALVVDLSDARTADDIDVAVAAAAGVGFSSDATTADRRHGVRSILNGWEGVVVLDNAESALSGVRELLRDDLDDARFLVTSREPLALETEHVIHLEPLVEAEAARYLRERAARLGDDFAIDDVDDEEVRKLADRLDGLPLAMELAAHRFNLLRPAALLERLEQPSDVLGSAPERAGLERSLHDAIASSWIDSSDVERRALVRLAVLDGPFGVALAEAAIASDGALDVLQRLRDRSLVAREPDGRLRLLLAIRDFIASHQTDDDQALVAVACHLARRADEWLLAAERLHPMEAVAELRANRRHLRKVVSRGVEEPDLFEVDVLVRCAAADAEIVILDGAHGMRLPELVELSETLQPNATLLDLRLGRMERDVGRMEDSAARFRRCRSHASDGAVALLEAAQTAVFRDDLEAASELVDEAAALDRTDGGRAIASLQRAGIHYHRGAYDDALDEYESAIRFARRARDRRTETRAMHNLGVLHTDRMNLEQARRYLRQAVERHREHGDRVRQAWARNSLGVVELRSRNQDEGIRCFEKAQELFDLVGLRIGSAATLANLGMIAVDHERYEQARGYALDAIERCGVEEDAYIRGMSYLCLAVATWFLGERVRAGELFEQHAGEVEGCGHVQLLISWYCAHGSYLAATGDGRADEVMRRGEALLTEAEGQEIYAKMFELGRAHAWLQSLREARAVGDERAATDAAFAVLERLRGCAPERSEPLRYNVRLLAHEAPDEVARLVGVEARADAEESLVASRTLQAFRPPHGEWTWLGRSPSIWRLFEVLLDSRQAHPGESLDVEALQQAVWPDEVLTHDSAKNRLHVSLSKLRSAGLKPVILRADDGYRFDENVAVFTA
jgi:predicted ATPase